MQVIAQAGVIAHAGVIAPLCVSFSSLESFNSFSAQGSDQGYGRGGTPIFTDVLEPLARVDLYPTDEDGLGTCFGAA